MELNKLCYVGNLREVKDFVEKLDNETLSENIGSRRGAFGYTPLHEAVASGKTEVLGYLLEKTNGAHINCLDVRSYTPLHLAASSGHLNCVKLLLEYSADISITDEYGRTPKQTAELNCRANITKVLRNAGTYLYKHPAHSYRSDQTIPLFSSSLSFFFLLYPMTTPFELSLLRLIGVYGMICVHCMLCSIKYLFGIDSHKL